MTNDDKASELCDLMGFADDKSCLDAVYRVTVEDALSDMANWKDEQFAEEKKQLIEKTCEWLKSQACCGYIEDVKVDEFIEQFKKQWR